LSSAILFLAIIAIWACALVPRWLRRSHEANSEQEVQADQAEATYYAEAPGHAEYGAFTEPGADVADMDPSPISYEAQPAYSDSPAWSDSPARSDPAARPDSGARYEAYGPNRYSPTAQAGGRARVLQARRRMLTMLVALAVAALGCVLTGLTRWWTAVPPVGMLLVYLLLLREAARADAEASRRAEAYARAEAARAARRYRAWEAQELPRVAREPEPAAEVIDISGRTPEAEDQLYDQYADAEVRAVGD
jgi:type IV secretory pathway TrbD component